MTKTFIYVSFRGKQTGTQKYIYISTMPGFPPFIQLIHVFSAHLCLLEVFTLQTFN